MPTEDRGTIKYYNKLMSGMDIERQSFIAHYKELQEYINTRRGRFFEQDRNKGTKRHQLIINSAATQALRIAVAGMLNGTMSPTRPWFSLEPFDPDLIGVPDMRQYLFQVETIIREILNQSNFYNMAPVFLKELLLFGTSCMTHVDDFDNVARFYTHTAGSYYLQQNSDLNIDTIARKFEWPVIQIVDRFGLDKVSKEVKTAYDMGNYNAWFPICHFIEPNKKGNSRSPLAKNKAYTSLYFEPGSQGVDDQRFLSESGFNQFPAYAPRWDVTEGDIYGVDCPGMTALGDVKHLQIEEKRKAQAIDKMVNPPLSGPPSVKNVPVSSLHGGLTIYEGDDQKQKLQPIYQVDPRLQELRLDMDAVEKRINNAFFVDLFLAISQMEGIQPRNQLDLMQRNEERLVQLGPVLERIHGEFLSLMVDRVFDQAAAAEILPDAPPALEGSPLRVRFISTLAMAQRAVVTSDIERITAFTGGLVTGGAVDAWDKLDTDQTIDEYGRALGVPPKVIRNDEDVAALRQQRAEQQQQQALLDQAAQVAGAASDMESSGLNDRISEEIDAEA